MTRLNRIRLKYASREPLKYGANAAAEFDEPSWPRFVRITDVNSKGALRDETFRSLPPEVAEPFRLDAGDILLARSGATVGKSFIYDEQWGEACFAGYLIRFRTGPDFESKFIYWWLQSNEYWSAIDSNMIQATIQNVSADRYSNFEIPVFPLEDQQRIARFLDEKTARIDALIEKKQALLERLAEKRQALITRAVTKGLNPDVPMKPSGVEWLGDIPANWKVSPLRRLALRVSTGRTPPSGFSDYFADGEINWFTPGDFGEGIELHDSLRKITHEALEDGVSSIFPRGTLFLVGIGATLGKVSVSTTAGSANQQINAIVLSEKNSPYFLAYYLLGFREEVRMTSNGNTLGILNQDGTKSLLIATPPDTEQLEIAEFLAEKDRKNSAVIGTVRRSIELLVEARSSVITAAVTGQLPELNS